MKKTLFNIIGYVALALGVVDAFLPLLPTTPFLLLAVYGFSKGNSRMEQHILNNRYVGKYLRDYNQGLGIPKAVKISAIISIWASISFTALLFIHPLWLKIGLFIIALFVSIHIIHIKTLDHEK